MSIQAMSYVFKSSLSGMGERLVLLSLANHANDAFIAWPAVQTIAGETQMHMRSVQRALRNLEKAGEVTPVTGYSRGGRETTTYELTRCKEWLDNVGAPTPKTPYGNRTQTVGLPNENAVTRSKNPPLPRHSAGGTPAQRVVGPGTAPGVPTHSAVVTLAQRQGVDTPCAGATPALRTEYPGTAPPNPSLNHHRTTPPPENPESPLLKAGIQDFPFRLPPSPGDGAVASAETRREEEKMPKRKAPVDSGKPHATDPQFEVCVLNLPDFGRLRIIKPVGATLVTPEFKAECAGMTAEQVAEKFRLKGWEAEVVIYEKRAD
jgi:helix-turn-helix protein